MTLFVDWAVAFCIAQLRVCLECTWQILSSNKVRLTIVMQAWCDHKQPALWSSKTRAVCHPLRCKWALWAQKWQPWHAKHVTSLLITCLGPCKQKIACGHAPPLVFFQKVMPQQQRMHPTKQTATTQEMQTRCWKQQTGPLKSDEQGYGGKKKSPNPFF